MLDFAFYGNTLRAWLIALAVLVVGTAVLMIVRRVLITRLSALASHTTFAADDFAVTLLRHTHTAFLAFLALGGASLALTLPALTRRYLNMVLGAVVILQMASWGNEAIAFWLRRYRTGQVGEQAGAQSTATAMGFMARLALWAVIILLLLDNFGLQVTTLIATLGVGGIAVALAAQSVLADLFAAMSIFLDKPFAIGDFIIFDEFLGSVQSVGLRSTRILSLSGEQIVISNSDLLKTRIRNYKRMFERRVVFSIGVRYGTPRHLLERIPGIIREAVEAQPSTRFDRSHFQGYGESALNFETVYYVLSPDYNVYMDTQQAINFAILRRFEEDGIPFAHPVRMMLAPAGGEHGTDGAGADREPQRGTERGARTADD